MNDVDLLGLRGVKTIGMDEQADRVFVDAEEEDRGVPQCERGGPVYKHGMRTISVRDSPIRRKPTILRLKRRRYRCQACGTILTNWIPGLRADRDMTDRLRYGPFRREAAKSMSFISFLRYHGIDLSTFEADLREGRF